METTGEELPEEITILAKEPNMVAHSYDSYTINGINFHTHSYDVGRSVQCSGVALVAHATSFDGTNNNNPVSMSKTYYGVIKDILELNYHHQGKIVLFKCDWIDNRVRDKWVKIDKFGVTMVNFKHLFNTGDKELDEPFIFASQATQVYYVQDPIDADWFAVLKSKQRDMYDMEERLDNSTEIGSFLPDLDANTQVNVSIGGSCVRTDIDGIMIVENQPSK